MKGLAWCIFGFGLALTLFGASLKLAGWKSQVEAVTAWETAVREGRVPDQMTRLSIPAGDEKLVVLNDATEQNLLLGPAWVEHSGAPGEKGNCIIAGHRDTHFRFLKDVKLGQEIDLESRGRLYHYRVVKVKVVSADNTTYYKSSPGPVLTLVTCYPFSYVGNAPQRYIVRAKLME